MKKEYYNLTDLTLSTEQEKKQNEVENNVNGALTVGTWKLIVAYVNCEMPSLNLKPKPNPVEQLKTKMSLLKMTCEEYQKHLAILKSLLGDEETQKKNKKEYDEHYFVSNISRNCIIAELAGINTEEEKAKSEVGKELFSKEE